MDIIINRSQNIEDIEDQQYPLDCYEDNKQYQHDGEFQPGFKIEFSDNDDKLKRGVFLKNEEKGDLIVYI